MVAASTSVRPLDAAIQQQAAVAHVTNSSPAHLYWRSHPMRPVCDHRVAADASGGCHRGYHRVLVGAEVSDKWLEVPPSAAEGMALWEEQASAFARALAQEDDEGLQRPVRVPWWPEATPQWRVVSNVATEMIHHGAEIAVLRDLNLRRDELRR
jgi:hypothetical protein